MRKMVLNLFIQGRGHHEASWRHPNSSPLALTDIEYYKSLARKAEAGLLHSVFLADAVALWDDIDKAPHNWLEPLTTLSALSQVTERIGLIATASTTYTAPYNLARYFASLDHISRGRVGWNIVTTWAADAAGNFGDQAQVSHADRYARAEDFMEAVCKLWDSWADDAILDDRSGGIYADAARITPADHTGPYYSVKGALNMPRGPQGRPVFVQAGSSPTGRNFAARYAEVIFTAHLVKETAQEFYQDVKSQAVQYGRREDQLHILPGLGPIIGSTEEEAQRFAKEMDDLADIEVGRKRLSGRFGGQDFSHLPLDKPLSAQDFPDVSTVQAARSRAELIIRAVEKDGLTLRQLLGKLAGARGHGTFVGTPEQLADYMEDWFTSGAADGFNLMPPVLPWMLDVLIEELLPILQKRNLFRSAYEGETLRDALHLEYPSHPAVGRGQ
jgi:FMN-dependent oxidoreductase (nitrilotriacetate monooxygenase family)